ncbi:MAG: hypothetical protein Kow0042_10110 [Calditrichia bacterium]
MPDFKRILVISLDSYLHKFHQSILREVSKQSGWELFLLAPSNWRIPGNGAKAPLEKATDTYYRIHRERVVFPGHHRAAFYPQQLKFLINTVRPDIMHIEAEGNSLLTFQALVYKERFAPHSKTILFLQNPNRNGSPWFLRSLSEWGLRKVDGIVCDPALLPCRQFPRNIQEKVLPLPHGVNVEAFRPRQLLELKYKLNPRHKTLVGLPANGSEKNGTREVLQVLSDFDCKFLSWGNENLKSNNFNRARAKEENFFWIPSVTHEEMAQYLNCLDIYLVPPSLQNTLLTPAVRNILEAMASAVPVLAPETRIMKHILGDSGWYYQGDSLSDLRQKFSVLISNKRFRRQLGWKGRHRVMKNFAVQIVAGKLIDIYIQVLGENGR